MLKNLLALSLLLITFGCTTVQQKSDAGKTSYISKKPDEIYTTPALKSFLAKNKHPKIVLRVSNAANKLASNNNIEMVYNTIEKVFIANGFQVRDRALFNQIVHNNDNSTNYENLYKKSDTDLIIELMDTNPVVLYTTNKYVDNNTGEEKTGSQMIRHYGSNVEFKVIIIKSNEFAGSYKFNQTPCTEGCVYQAPIMNAFKNRHAKTEVQDPVYADITASYDKEKYEDFIKLSTQNLIDAMRNGN